MEFIPGQPRWWQWPTILSLDAPLVAISWQALVARVAGTPLAAYHIWLLAAGVWLSYSADRWIEAWRLTERTVRTQRHFYSLRWRWPILAVWLGVFAFSLEVAIRYLSGREWMGSLSLLAPTLLYLLSHQLLHRHHPWRIPKEIVVSGILTYGAIVYPVVNAPAEWRAAAGPGLIFFALALANLLLISEWELEVDLVHRQTSAALQYRGIRVATRTLLAATLVLSGAYAFGHGGIARRAGECGVLSGLLLTLLSGAQPRIGRQRARAAVDFALLTPLLALILP